MIDKIDFNSVNCNAIFALYKNVRYVDGDFGARDWNNEQVQIDKALIGSWVDPNAYVVSRQAAYPSLADQLDAFWKGGAAAEEMKATVMAVKEKYPK